MTTENCGAPFQLFRARLWSRVGRRFTSGYESLRSPARPAGGGKRTTGTAMCAKNTGRGPAGGPKRVPADPAGDGHTDYISFLQVKTPFLSPASDAAATRHVIVTLRHSSLHEGGLDNLNRGCTRRLLRRVSTFRNNYPDTARTPPALVHGPPRKRSPISSDHWAIQGPTH
jgi:hypothetical protein